MKEIPLSQGQFALVDDEDYEYLSINRWYYQNGYAVRSKHVHVAINKYTTIAILMHRVILKCKKNQTIDHINRNGMDNRKSNLRIVTKSQNAFNTTKKHIVRVHDNVSRHRGVHWDKYTHQWKSEIQILGKRIWLGRFDSEEEAAKAYNSALIRFVPQHGIPNEVAS